MGHNYQGGPRTDSIVLTTNNVEMLRMLSCLRVMTEKQICALFYSKHDSYDLDMLKARRSLSPRIAEFVKAGLIEKAAIPSVNRINRQGYLLGPEGAKILKDIRETERMEHPRCRQRRYNDILVHSRHDLAVNNFLTNLIMLSRLHPCFSLVEWLADRDCRFYISKGPEPKILDPDLFLHASQEDGEPRSLFVEVDCDTLSRPVLRRKVLRLFQYYVSGTYEEDLAVRYFPRMAIIAPDAARVRTFQSVIREVKREFSNPYARRIPFYLATFDQVDINCIDEGRVSTDPIEAIWVDWEGNPVGSPFCEQLPDSAA